MDLQDYTKALMSMQIVYTGWHIVVPTPRLIQKMCFRIIF